MTNKSLLSSSLVNNRWYENMLVGNAAFIPNAYEWLESVILTGTQATFSFSNLNSTYGSTYQHLQLRGTMRTNRASQPFDTILFRYNSDAGTYANHRLRGDGSSVTSTSASPDTRNFIGDAVPASTSTANIFGAFVLDILDPFETTKNTTYRLLYGVNAGSQVIDLSSGVWVNSAAITSIEFDAIGDFIAGTRVSLYGLRSA